MTNPILKNNIKTISLCFIALFIISQRTSAQNSILGFKTADKQNKIENEQVLLLGEGTKILF